MDAPDRRRSARKMEGLPFSRYPDQAIQESIAHAHLDITPSIRTISCNFRCTVKCCRNATIATATRSSFKSNRREGTADHAACSFYSSFPEPAVAPRAP